MYSLDLTNGLFDVVNKLEGVEVPEKYSGIKSIGELRLVLASNIQELDLNDLKALLNIYVDALENSSLKKSDSEWASQKSSYFSGNAHDKWIDIFSSGNFTYDDLIDFTKEINEKPSRRAIEFGIRNSEVTLRDDTNVDPSLKGFNEKALIGSYVNRIKQIAKK